MVVKVTQKQVKEIYGEKIISVPYCTWQSILRPFDPFAYNAGIYGWNFDIYDVGGWAIVSGYRTIKTEKEDYKLMHYLEEQMRNYVIEIIRNFIEPLKIEEEEEKKAKELIEQYIMEVKK